MRGDLPPRPYSCCLRRGKILSHYNKRQDLKIEILTKNKFEMAEYKLL